jgi:hypothetical protein
VHCLFLRPSINTCHEYRGVDLVAGKLGMANVGVAARFQIGLLLCLAVFGLSAPYVANAGVAPSWLELLLKGSDGRGAASWVVVGWLNLAAAVYSCLQLRANRLETSRVGRAGLVAVVGLIGLCIAVLFSVLAAAALYAAAEAGHLPSAFAEKLFDLRRDGSFMTVTCAIAALHPAIWALAYMCHHKLLDQNAYDALRRSSGSVMCFWLLVGVVATAYIFWVGPAARTAT